MRARSLALCLDPSFSGTIVLLVNDLRQGAVITRMRHAILPEDGRWRSRVRIVPFHHLGHELDPSNGWKIQRALKLAVASILDKPFYVTLDSKDHLVRRVRVTDFATALGVGRRTLSTDEPTLNGHFRACARFLGRRPEEVEPCSPKGVPLRIIYLRNPGYLRGTGVTDDELMARMRAGGAAVLDLTLPHEGHGDVAIPGDGHPSRAGNRLRARILLNAVGAERSGTVSSTARVGSGGH